MNEPTFNRKITVAEMAPHVHSFLPNENKADKILGWITNWILHALETEKIKPHDFLPLKSDLAFHIGVSQGTIQNVFRQLENKGIIESKQRIGSYIAEINQKKSLKKLTSKRESTVEKIKKYIKFNNKLGDYLLSTRKLGDELDIPPTGIRVAIDNLISMKILRKAGKKFEIINLDFKINDIESENLIEKISKLIKADAEKNLKIGEKLPSNTKLAEKYHVSAKTIHDSVKKLSKQGVLYVRRGKYGTVYVGEKTSENNELYNYEKIENKIRNYINKNTKVGDKLLSIKDFANKYKTSEKTIKRALDNLREDGYITYIRGRYGGTFVTDIPQGGKEAYRWLALNEVYVPKNNTF